MSEIRQIAGELREFATTVLSSEGRPSAEEIASMLQSYAAHLDDAADRLAQLAGGVPLADAVLSSTAEAGGPAHVRTDELERSQGAGGGVSGGGGSADDHTGGGSAGGSETTGSGPAHAPEAGTGAGADGPGTHREDDGA